MNDVDFMDNCVQCDGTGWVWGQEYGFSWPAEVRDGEVATPIQRCDMCERWEGDWDAAQQCLAQRFDGDGVVVWGVLDWTDHHVDERELPPVDVFVITVKENL